MNQLMSETAISCKNKYEKKV